MDKVMAEKTFQQLATDWQDMRRYAVTNVEDTVFARFGHTWASRRLVLRLENLLEGLREACGAE